MRRADRLFQLIQILRRNRQPITAATIARELEVSKRTVYRDITDLIGQRVPIEGEPGQGYRLQPGYDLPPMMFNADELETLMLGLDLVQQLPDDTLMANAKDILTKIRAVVPKHKQPVFDAPNLMLKPDGKRSASVDTRLFRTAIRQKQKIHLTYRDQHNHKTNRTVWPILIGYDDQFCVLIAWCELRKNFRLFRVDRIQNSKLLLETIPTPLPELRRLWRLHREQELNQPSEHEQSS